MSRENVELIRQFQPSDVDLVEVFTGEHAREAPLVTAGSEFFAADFEVSWIADDDQRIDYQGLEGFLAGWQDWLEPWSTYWMETEDFIDAGDDVVVFVKVTARTVHGDVLVHHAPAAIWSIRDGKISAIRFYLDRDVALEAAGLER